jgi:glyoxylase-like metal-dependent hydrolase (beta-lactamase superfamily II)
VIFRQFLTEDTGCAAYLLGCGGRGVAAVVDPSHLDVERYLAFASARNLSITQVLDTHLHADHRSGGRELAARTGAAYRLHRAAETAFRFEAMSDGERIAIGNIAIEVIHTPGHSPDSVCLLVADLTRGPEPWFLLTGDTLFAGAVGRPDLHGDRDASARLLHASLHDRILELPGELEIYPAHFGGSLCGVGISGKPATTLGFERRCNPLLALGLESFVTTVSRVPEEPAAMREILRVNRGLAPEPATISAGDARN